VTLDEALGQLLSSLKRLSPQSVPLDESAGLVLADRVAAVEDVPPFANAAMDGFAVSSSDVRDVPTRLRMAGSVNAGHVSDVALTSGTAIAIATGAPMPEGADAVCMVEHCVVEDNTVVLEALVAKGENVRQRGEEIAQGAVVFEKSTVIGPSQIGVLSSIGIGAVEVFPRVRVGVLSTGDELRSGAAVLEHGQIHDSNRHMLLSAVAAVGGEAVNLGVVGDDVLDIANALEKGAVTCDVIITSGGVSVGVADHMKNLLHQLSDGGAQWMEIAIKPGKPFGFAVLVPSGVPVLCVPGNPTAAMVSFELLARPALRFMMGHLVLRRPAMLGIAQEDLVRKKDGKVHYRGVVARVDEEGRLVVRPLEALRRRGMRSLVQANALAVLPEGEGVRAGQTVHVIVVEPSQVQGGDSS
jgi:molybdenum cofactor synthesis domain-containing protein